MKRLLAILLCTAGLVAAQNDAAGPVQKPAEKEKWLQKVFDVKYANPVDLELLLGNLVRIGSNDRIHGDKRLGVVSVGTWEPSFLQLAEEVIKRYDVPKAAPANTVPKGVELVAHILLAGPKGSSGDALPEDLTSVAKQLRSVFGYTDIRLLDSALIRGREGRSSEVSGNLDGLLQGLKVPSTYRIRVKGISVEQSPKGNLVALEGFLFSIRSPFEAGPGQFQFQDLGFDTDLNALEGQKVVVGKSHVGPGKEALVLVLTAHVVE